MTEKVTLTIGIPTFNRRDAILERVRELFENPLPRNVSVLVVDNHSTDGTYECLLEESGKRDRLRVLRNPENLGYAGNFFRLFDEVDKGYLLVDSDEDEVLVEKLPEFLKFLEKNSPSFVSPQAIVFDRVYRGGGKSGEIAPAEFRKSSNYLSGITFDVSSAREACARVRAVVTQNAAAHVYPQVLVVAEVLSSRRRAFWYPEAITFKRQQLQSHITNPDGGAYFHLVGRYQQNLGFFDYLSKAASDKSTSVNAASAFEAMLKAAGGRIFHDFRKGLGRENPDLLKAFDHSGRRFYQGWFGKLVLAVREPGRILLYIRRRWLRGLF